MKAAKEGEFCCMAMADSQSVKHQFTEIFKQNLVHNAKFCPWCGVKISHKRSEGKGPLSESELDELSHMLYAYNFGFIKTRKEALVKIVNRDKYSALAEKEELYALSKAKTIKDLYEAETFNEVKVSLLRHCRDEAHKSDRKDFEEWKSEELCYPEKFKREVV